MTLAEKLAEIAKWAPELRRRGVLKLDTDELYLELAEYEDTTAPAAPAEQTPSASALDHADTYGGTAPPSLELLPDQEEGGGEFDEHGRPLVPEE